MKKFNLILLSLFIGCVVMAQNKTLKLWPNGAPDDNGMTDPEENYDGVRVRNVSEAEI